MSAPGATAPPRHGRRWLLALLAAGVPGGAISCSRREPPDRRSRVPLERLGAAERLEVEHEGDPVEVVRTSSGLLARSLLCSHFGCRVEWRAATRDYRCPCHEGLFDAEGRPVGGPPTRPLRRLPLEVSGRDILIGER